jgi:FkbM family methyltransferase
MDTFKKQPLLKLVLGQKSSLRFRISKKIYWLGKSSWRTSKRLSRKLTGRNAYLRVGKNLMEVPEDMLWAFTNGYYYEKNVSFWLEKMLLGTNRKVFYDIGANYGYYCLKFAYSASHIYAFEPVSQTYDVLSKNKSKNNLVNINAYKLGLSNTNGSTEINVYSSSGNNSLFFRNLPKNHPTRLIGREVINLVTLDDIVQNEKLCPPDLIKIDIEGGELYALKGAKQIIKEYQPALFIEYSEAIFKDAGYSRSDLLTELEAHNYVIYGIPKDVEDLMLYPLTKFDGVVVENIIALPKNMEVFISNIVP